MNIVKVIIAIGLVLGLLAGAAYAFWLTGRGVSRSAQHRTVVIHGQPQMRSPEEHQGQREEQHRDDGAQRPRQAGVKETRVLRGCRRETNPRSVLL